MDTIKFMTGLILRAGITENDYGEKEPALIIEVEPPDKKPIIMAELIFSTLRAYLDQWESELNQPV